MDYTEYNEIHENLVSILQKYKIQLPAECCGEVGELMNLIERDLDEFKGMYFRVIGQLNTIADAFHFVADSLKCDCVNTSRCVENMFCIIDRIRNFNNQLINNSDELLIKHLFK